jgi:hypothetical protein
MSAPAPDRRQERREAKLAAILDEAWGGGGWEGGGAISLW